MSTVVIIVIVVIAVVIVGILLASARRAKATRDLGTAQVEAKRDDVGFHREEAAQRRTDASVAEERAKRVAAEADLHEERADRRESELERDEKATYSRSRPSLLSGLGGHRTRRRVCQPLLRAYSQHQRGRRGRPGGGPVAIGPARGECLHVQSHPRKNKGARARARPSPFAGWRIAGAPIAITTSPAISG
jgi:FtsZ-interacting cell division protein ZipA